MRTFYILLLSLCLSASTFAQQVATDLVFNKKYTQCERNWVALPKADTASNYLFGFIYIDAQAGFTFDLKGSFRVDANNVYQPDTSTTKNGSIKYRIQPNWTYVGIIDPKRFQQLNIKPEPDWVRNYYSYTDSVEHNYRWGWVYNEVGEFDTALYYLNKAYKVNPRKTGLAFEIAFSYNAANRFDDAIKFLETEVKKSSENLMLYRELGYAYLHKGDPKRAIDVYKVTIDKCNDKQNDIKAEIAINMAAAYKNLGNSEMHTTWMQNAKSWAPAGSKIEQFIIKQGF